MEFLTFLICECVGQGSLRNAAVTKNPKLLVAYNSDVSSSFCILSLVSRAPSHVIFTQDLLTVWQRKKGVQSLCHQVPGPHLNSIR